MHAPIELLVDVLLAETHRNAAYWCGGLSGFVRCSFELECLKYVLVFTYICKDRTTDITSFCITNVSHATQIPHGNNVC